MKKIDRRGFLKGGVLAAASLGFGSRLVAEAMDGSSGGGARAGSGRGHAVGSGSSAIGSRSARATTAGARVVVIVNLFGGNDGLNTVIPLAQSEYDRYRHLRPTLRYDRDEILPLSGQPDFGLNRAMGAFQGLFNQGKLAIVNGVGVPETASELFSHEAGQYEFQSCDIERSVVSGPPSGWLGRFLDDVEAGPVTPGIDLGGGRLMLSGAHHVPVTINSVRRFQLQVSGADRSRRRAAYQDLMGHALQEGGVGERARAFRVQAIEESDVIQAATAGYVPSVTYPDTYLGFHLSECARILYGNVGTRALAVGADGFDTHSDQNAKGGQPQGYHETLLGDVSDSIAAFYTDLVNQGLSSGVLILTISEFGRRALENGDKGTDHGFGSVGFALGDSVNGGIYGNYPSLNSLVLDGNQATTTDFRSVYASIAANHLNVDPDPIVGGSYPLVPFV